MYAKISNGEVIAFPYSTSQLQADNKNVSFVLPLSSDILAQHGMVEVSLQTQPAFNEKTHVCEIERFPKNVDGVWTHCYAVRQKTSEELADSNTRKADAERRIRDAKLAESDWSQLADAPVDKAKWGMYRQALRDVTKQAGFPWEVQWPTKPE